MIIRVAYLITCKSQTKDDKYSMLWWKVNTTWHKEITTGQHRKKSAKFTFTCTITDNYKVKTYEIKIKNHLISENKMSLYKYKLLAIA